MTNFCYSATYMLLLKWTYYPNGQGAVTVNVDLSGIWIDDGDGSPPRLAMLNDGQPQDINAEIDKANVRCVEILRHLPVAVGRFDVDGTIIAQNPESMKRFGLPQPLPPSSDETYFSQRFMDRELGRKVLKEIVNNGKDRHIEAQLLTQHGPRWFAIDLRLSRDPVTSRNSILYSAQDITSLVEAKKEADEANSAKDEFFAILAHEIRTPLHQVNSCIELLIPTELTKQQAEYIDLMDQSAVCMMSVINDLLDYTKITAGKMELENIPFDARDVVLGALAVVQPKVKEKGLVMSSNLDSALIPTTILGDPNRLRQLLLNFLSNSVKFTHAGGQISLTVSKVDEKAQNDSQDFNTMATLEFSVSDTGIGLSPEHIKILFQKYQQACPSVARQYGGTGLGLAICKSLTAQMGGTIGVESDVGQGARFWFRIPFRIQPDAIRSTTEPVPNPADEMRGLHVLVAEDNKVNQKLAMAMLKRLGHRVTVVEDGKKAVDAVEATKFDLILMDVQMPVMNGLDATRYIRKLGMELPIVGLTASYRRCDSKTYADAGMDDCIAKPVRLEFLKSSIYANVIVRDRSAEWKKCLL